MKKNDKTMEKDYESTKYTEDPWELINSYFRKEYLERLVRHQLESYNDFVKNKIGIIVKQFNPLSIYNAYDAEKNTYLNVPNIIFDLPYFLVKRVLKHLSN